MSTTTPRTDENSLNWDRANRPGCDADFARTIETELTAANARIAELEGVIRKSDRELVEISNRLTQANLDCASLAAQLAEAQTEIRRLTIACEKEFQSVQKLNDKLSESQAQLAKKQDDLDVQFGQLQESRRQLASAREDGELLNWLEINHIEFAEELHRIGWSSPNDAQWEKLKFFLRRIRHAIKSARGDCTSPSTSAEPGPASTSMWSYSFYRSTLCRDGKPWAIVSPDGRNKLTESDADLLLRAMNGLPPSSASTWQPIETAPRDGTFFSFVGPTPRGTIHCLL